MAKLAVVVHFTVCRCSVAELIDRMAHAISEHLRGMRHPDGVAPTVLAEDLVARLQADGSVLVDDDGRRLT